MTVITPPLFLTVDSEYDGSELGLPYRDLVHEGVVGSTSMAVSERGAGANLSVDVAAGVAWVAGDESALQPTYRCYNDGTVNLAIAAADATNPRIDLVICEVRDSAFAGVSTDWRLRVVTGTPAGSPAAPSTPNNAIVLARVSVPANDTTIANAQITDYRQRAGLGAVAPVTVTALPTDPYDGQVIDYLADATNGVVWRLKYRAAASGSYKWEFIGGAPLRANVFTSESTASTTYATMTTPVAVTVPLAGDYDFDYSAGYFQQSVGSTFAYLNVGVNGAPANDNGAAYLYATGGNTVINARATDRKTVTTAGHVARHYYRSQTGGSGTVTANHRTLLVTPVRVG